jgi:hypothetical protein
MAETDKDIDRLYQLPLAEFTAARDELAKHTEGDRAAVKRLQKPNVPAWAVNQLYWRERDAYDALVRAAQALRASQAMALKGKASDVARLEAAHESALRTAADRIRKLLAGSGETASPATMTAVRETLQALPAPGDPGRLTRPLKPLGFEALSELLSSAGAARSADVLPFKTADRKTETEARPKPGAARQVAKAREIAAKEEQARRREVAKVEADLHSAKAAERSARDALSRARAALTNAEKEHQKLKAELDAIEQELEQRTETLRAAEESASAASAAREKLETRLANLS